MAIIRIFIAVSILLATLPPVVRADFYQWTDGQGNTHVTTTPPPKKVQAGVQVTESQHKKPPPRSLNTKKVLHDTGFLTGPGSVYTPPIPKQAPPPNPVVVRRPPKVEIFGAPWCSWCTKTKAYFKGKGISYTEYNVDADKNASARLKSYNPKGSIPVTVIGGQAIIGYSPSQFEAALQR